MDELLLENQELDARYAVVGTLGSGGSASVYLVEDRELNCLCAWKVQRTEKEHRRSLQEEIEVLQALQHPNIIKVFGYHQFEKLQLTAISLEYLRGGSLREKIVAGPLSEAEAIQVATDVLSGLEYLHQRGILHGDIKPDNILFSAENIAKLADFGLAREVSDAQRSTIEGSLLYLAPEVLEGANASPQSDLYSFGLTVYEALTGTPYTSIEESSLPTKRLIRQQRQKIANLKVGSPLKNLLFRLLEPAPTARLASAGEALALVRAAVSTPKSSKRRWRVAAASLFLALILFLPTTLGKLLLIRLLLYTNHYLDYPISAQRIEAITRPDPDLFTHLIRHREMLLAEFALASGSTPHLDQKQLLEITLDDSSTSLLSKLLARMQPSTTAVQQLLKHSVMRRKSEKALLIVRHYPHLPFDNATLFDILPHWPDLNSALLHQELDQEVRAILTAYVNNDVAGKALSSRGHQFEPSTTDGLTSLHYAAMFGPISTRFILSEGFPVDPPDSKSRTALHLAVINNRISSAAVLLEFGANVNQRDVELKTPLWYAVRNVNIGMTKLLLENGADVSASGIPDVPLTTTAVFQGSPELLKLLLEFDPRAHEYGTLSPIGVAVAHGKLEAVKLLLQYGANPNTVISYTVSPASLARRAITYWNGFLLDELLSAGANLNEVSAKGKTLLEEAWEARALIAVEVLIKHGVKVDTPIHRKALAQGAVSHEHYPFFEQLTKAVDFSPSIRLGEGKTVLALAISAENRRAVLKLLEFGEACILDQRHRSALMELISDENYNRWNARCASNAELGQPTQRNPERPSQTSSQ